MKINCAPYALLIFSDNKCKCVYKFFMSLIIFALMWRSHAVGCKWSAARSRLATSSGNWSGSGVFCVRGGITTDGAAWLTVIILCCCRLILCHRPPPRGMDGSCGAVVFALAARSIGPVRDWWCGLAVAELISLNSSSVVETVSPLSGGFASRRKRS